MRNLEFKVRIDDPEALLAKARSLGAELWGDLRQTDTYFATKHGRLKVRETSGHQSELISYDRDEEAPDRPSDYALIAFKDAGELRAALSRTLGVVAVVRKRRTLLVLDTTRIHLDNVDGLGHFLEIEVPVTDQQSAAERMSALLAGLGFTRDDCIRGSYADLVIGRGDEAPESAR